MTENQKNVLKASLRLVFNPGQIPGIEVNHFSPNFCEVFLEKIKEDEQLALLFATIEDEKEAAEFYLLEMKEFFDQKSKKAEFLYNALHRCK